MANPEHLKILRTGVGKWNKWRIANPKVEPDLSDLNLSGIDLSGADLTDTKFVKTIFRKAKLDRVNFSRAVLVETDFSGALIAFSRFVRNPIEKVCFEGAQLDHSVLFRGWWDGIKLCRAGLYGTTFYDCEATRVDFSQAILSKTIFSNVDLSQALGLEKARHEGPSTIGTDTLYRSGGKIPAKFLRDAGVPEELISYLPFLIGAVEPIQLQSCFISYSTKNQKFAERLHSRMRQAGLRVWFASEDMKGGDHFFEQIERAIQVHDRLLLVLSEDSIKSKWVEREIRKTRKIERAEKRRKLFPITLTDYATLKKWECLDSDTGEDLAEEVRKYHIPDFSNWKNHDAFERAFARLEKDLRTSIGQR
jgi:hypothetical protein